MQKHKKFVTNFSTLDKDIRDSIKQLKTKLSEPNTLLLRKNSDKIKQTNQNLISQMKIK